MQIQSLLTDCFCLCVGMHRCLMTVIINHTKGAKGFVCVLKFAAYTDALPNDCEHFFFTSFTESVKALDGSIHRCLTK